MSVLTEQQRELRMGRLTWLVLSIAFMLWLSLATTAALWGRSVVQYSTRPAPTTLDQISGVVLYREAGQRTEISAQQGMQLFDGDEVATSQGATASLQSFDGGMLTLYPEARLRVDAARVGRFNPGATEAAFSLLSGTMRISIPEEPEQPHALRLAVAQATVTLSPGQYTVRVSPDATRISVWQGSVDAIVADAPLPVTAGHKIILNVTGSPSPRVVDVLEDVLLNGSFARSFESWDPWEDREQGRPDVPGHLEIVPVAGGGEPVRALRITRTSQRDAHNETGLRQTVGRDVTGARAIRVEALVRVDHASLSGGGYIGSEYPLMLRVRARDRRGGEQTWVRGFYYANPESRPTPDGEQVPQGQWVQFAADLTERFAQAATIDSIEVYGAGHTFDASIGSIELLVD
jgi:hypothetical protein